MLNRAVHHTKEKSMDPLFQFYQLNDEGRRKAQLLAIAFNDLLATITPLMPVSSREVAIVRTKLEEACFFAKKSISQAVENQGCE